MNSKTSLHRIKMFRLEVIVFCVFCTSINFIFTIELPHYIKPCSVKDPEEFNKCFVKIGNEAIPHLVKGDKKYKIPILDPLKIDKIKFSPSPQLVIDVDNIDVYGLKETEVRSGRIDLENQNLFFQIFVPNVTIVGDYVAKGRILVLPLEGNGRMKLEIIKVLYNYTLEFENMNFESTKPLKFKNSDINFYQENVIFNFENLFNGNKLLSEETNKVLTENWMAVHEDLSPIFGKTIDELVRSIVGGTLEQFYFKDAFLP